MKLYEITQGVQDAMDRVDPETGELAEDVAEQLDALDMAFEAKAENVAKAVRSILAEADAHKEESKRQALKARARGNDAARLKEYLQVHMEIMGLEKIKGDLLTVALQKCPPSCAVLDEERVPDGYKELVTETKVHKKDIIDHWKATGETVDGVEIDASRKSLRIR